MPPLQPRTPVAFVGIGNMGAPMVRCLAGAGWQVRVFDVRRAAAEAVAAEATGITVAVDLPSAARGAAAVITMLPDSQAVRSAVGGERDRPGLIDGLAAGGLVIDMSSSYPIDTRALGERLAARSIGLIDAPVSGGVGKAVSGTLAIMAGGDPADVTRATPLLEAMGRVLPTGALGTGHAMKALNNYVSAAGLIATAEALVVGARFGLDPAVMVGILNASTGRNNTTENKAERYMLSGAYDSGFALKLMEKDVGMARRLAAAIGVPAAELGFVADLLTQALAALGEGADHTEVHRYIAEAGRGG